MTDHERRGTQELGLQVKLLGSFAISLGAQDAGPWPRPPAKRLCELVLASPGRRVSRDQAYDALFPGQAPQSAARALVKALSMARGVLAKLGGPASRLLAADRANIWVPLDVPLEIDADGCQEALRSALSMPPEMARDDGLVAALAEDGTFLADEPYADWAIGPRDRLDALRQQGRLALARDRAKGAGRPGPAALLEAWEACLEHDPTCEEAAAALVRTYEAQGLRSLALRAYERCRHGLEELGLRPSPALEEVRVGAISTLPGAGARQLLAVPGDERRVVSILFAEVLAAPAALKEDPEDLRDVLGDSLASAITAVEGLGGTVTSVSGAGLQALFGAPEAHEDDPERAVRAAFRALSASPGPGAPVLRIGVETGPAIVGTAPVEAGTSSYHRVVGRVVGAAAALQSVAQAGSVLVGPATRAATEGVFDWGPTEQVLLAMDAKPLVGAYLERPRARAPARQLRLGGRGPLVGREPELSTLIMALHGTEEGKGSVVVVEGEPGLGKTRLVQECRKRFMAWVGARSGRLPLWAEGRCASYASTTPLSLYRHLVASWAGVAPDQPEAIVAPALERALVAVMGDRQLWPVLARTMDLAAGAELAPMGPADLQRATFGALRSIVGRLARAGPTVLVLEDLHWADATSLQLTVDLAPLALEGPLLMLLTRRPHPDPGVSATEAAIAKALGAHLSKVTLAPLAPKAEQELATILVGENAGPGVVDAVRAGTEGNPLYVEERLFSMVELGALVGGPGAWRLADGAILEVPQVLERMVRSRVDHLGPGAQAVVRTASVIGTEPSLALLSACGRHDEIPAQLAELAKAGLLGELSGAAEPTYRFRHALIQEAIYRGLLRTERRRLHGRVAWALETLSEGRLPEVAAILGRHFAAAGEGERAVHYFELAGDRAEAAYANQEAIASYRAALDLAQADPSAYSTETRHQLWFKLAGPLGTVGRRDDERHALYQALALVGPSGTLHLAQIHTWLGANYSQDRRFDDAVPHFEAAKNLLPDKPLDADEACVEPWVELMNCWSELYRNQSLYANELTVLEEIQPVVDARGTVRQRSQNLFLIAKAQAELARYRVSDEVISDMHRATEMVPDRGQQIGDGWQPMMLGYLAFLKGDVELAREQLERGLAMAEKTGEAQLRAAAMVVRPMTALRGHDVQGVRELAPLAVTACEGIGFPEWVAMAKGSLAWLAYQEGRHEDVLALAAECDELMKAPHGPEIFVNWVRLWPVVAVHLAAGRVELATDAARQMLDPSQQRFEDELESLLVSACDQWDHGDPRAARGVLEQALVLARELRYF